MAFEILKHTSPNGIVLGIDLDSELLEKTKQKAVDLGLNKRLITQRGNFANLKNIIQGVELQTINNKLQTFRGIVFDFGMSSYHIDSSGRGFSFAKDEFLDMRFSKDFTLTAYEVVNTFPENELADIIWRYGDEIKSRRIASAIIQARKHKRVETSAELSRIIIEAKAKVKNIRVNQRDIRVNPRFGRLHPATKTFQALRIFINHELENIERAMPQIFKILPSGGSAVIISFHSLEDRIVKNFMRDAKKQGKITFITKKPITPSYEEVKINPRSRSSKLRAFKIL